MKLAKLMVVGGFAFTVALVSMGCGGKMSDEEKTAVSQALSPMVSGFQAMGKGYAGQRAALIRARRAADDFRAQQIIDRNSTSALTIEDACPDSNAMESGTDASCEISCAGGVMTFTCTGIDDTALCGDDTYTIADGSVTLTIDVTNIDVTGSAATGSFSIGLDLEATLSGGALPAAGKLACSFLQTFDLEAAAAQAATLDCNDFDCSFDGNSISCEDLQTQMGATSCTATSAGDTADDDEEEGEAAGICDQVDDAGICVNYTGSAWSSIAEAQCSIGTFDEDGTCPTDGLIGTCVMSDGTSSEYEQNYYDTVYTASTAEDYCDLVSGDWTAAR